MPVEDPPTYYSTPAEVIEYTGARASHIGVESEDALALLIEKWLKQIKNIIDVDRNRDFLAEAGSATDVQPLVHNVAMRAAANMYGMAQVRRETPVIRVDDFNVRVVPDSVLTSDLRKDLRRVKSKPTFRMQRVPVEISDDG